MAPLQSDPPLRTLVRGPLPEVRLAPDLAVRLLIITARNRAGEVLFLHAHFETEEVEQVRMWINTLFEQSPEGSYHRDDWLRYLREALFEELQQDSKLVEGPLVLVQTLP